MSSPSVSGQTSPLPASTVYTGRLTGGCGLSYTDGSVTVQNPPAFAGQQAGGCGMPSADGYHGTVETPPVSAGQLRGCIPSKREVAPAVSTGQLTAGCGMPYVQGGYPVPVEKPHPSATVGQIIYGGCGMYSGNPLAP